MPATMFRAFCFLALFRKGIRIATEMKKEILYERALNMRLNPTKAEKRFAELLEINNINFKQQYVIGSYIADFVIEKTVIELDGASHIGREVYDEIRDSNIRAAGYKVIRLLNSEIETFNFEKLRKSNFKHKVTAPKKYNTLEVINSHHVKSFRSKKQKRKPKGKVVIFNQPLSAI